MGARCVGHGGGGQVPPPRFCESNVKSLIFTIGAPPPVLLMCPPVFIVTGRPCKRLENFSVKVQYVL